MKISLKIGFTVLASLALINTSYSQEGQEKPPASTGIATGAEFLLYNTDVRSSAMGNMKSIGITDAFSIYSNPAKLSYQEDVLQNDISISYTPVLQNFTKDMNIISIASNNLIVGGKGREHFLAFGYQYFSMGSVQLTDQQGNVSQFLRPREMSFNLAYSTEVLEYLHMGITLKGIYSKLVNSEYDLKGYKTAFAGALDYGIYLNYPIAEDGQLNAGYTLKNLGSKLKYGNDSQPTGLPTTMNLGLGYTKRIIDDNSYFFIGAEGNKPFVSSDRENNSPLPIAKQGGIGYSVGAELMYRSIFSAMAGYDVKSPEFGGLNYITTGIGVNTYFNKKKIAITGSFLIPTEKEFSAGNVYRVGLSFSIIE